MRLPMWTNETKIDHHEDHGSSRENDATECHKHLRPTHRDEKLFPAVILSDERKRGPQRAPGLCLLGYCSEESKDPYTAHSLSPATFFDRAKPKSGE